MVNRLYIILNDFADLSAIEISSHTLVEAYSLSSGETVADVVYVPYIRNVFAVTRNAVRSEVEKEL